MLANQENAKKSTGPKTPEGKARSRANALKHGLCSSVVVPESLEVVQQRDLEWYYTLKPQTEYHSWLVEKIAIVSLRIDRCERIERRIRDRRSLHAEITWADDRRLEAEVIGGTLASRPGEVVEELRKTSSGCEWLIKRWALLAHAADSNGKWTEDQALLAFHLMGTPREFRPGQQPGALVDDDGRVTDGSEDQASVARRELAELRVKHEELADLDEVDRSLIVADLNDESSPDLRRLRRYETALHRRLRWYLDELKYESPHRRPHPDLKPRWRAEPDEIEVEEIPEKSPVQAPLAADQPQKPLEPWQMKTPNPPFDLRPDEIPTDFSIPIDPVAILAARAAKRLQKAEARRAARRRKVERLRA